MLEERRDQQSSPQPLGYHAANTSRTTHGDKWKDTNESFLDRWSRLNIRAAQKDVQFNNLLLHVNKETLYEAFKALDGSKASGVDEVTKKAYGKNLEENISSLEARVKNGSYRPKPKREVLIPKPSGGTRPLEIACFEDKLVDWVVSKILTQVFDPIFIRNSFGFRPNKSAHKAIDACYYSLMKGQRPYVVEIDFKSFFNTIPHRKLIRVLKEKVVDRKFISLIKRFLASCVLDESGNRGKTRAGTPQGGLMSPVLANIYLNVVLDQWFLEHYASYTSVIVRYADDAVFIFKDERKAKDFLKALKLRVKEYGLTLNEDKTKMIVFKKGNTSSFNFLGFTFYWGKQNKKRLLKVKTEKQKHLNSIREFYHWIKLNRNKYALKDLWEKAKVKIQGHLNYFGYWVNQSRVSHFYYEAKRSLFKWLNRRSQKLSYTWSGFMERLRNLPLIKNIETLKLKKLGRTYVSDFLYV